MKRSLLARFLAILLFYISKFEVNLYHTTRSKKCWSNLTLKRCANTDVKVDALVVEECRRITTYLKGYSYPKLYCKKLRNQKPKANTVSFSTRRTTFFSDKFFKQCDRVGKTKKIYTACNLALEQL